VATSSRPSNLDTTISIRQFTIVDSEPLMTTDEVARELRVTRQTVTRWIRSGRLSAITIRVNSRPLYRIRRSAFRSFAIRYVRGDW
jgi:excisionase family DNA binding protein